MIIEQSGTTKSENILPDQDKYLIKDLKPGKCVIKFVSVFGDIMDTTICFDKRVGLTLKYELPNYQVDQVSIDSLITTKFSKNDTLYLFYNIEGCFAGNDQGLITIIIDDLGIIALLDDKIYDNNSNLIQSKISLEDLGKVVSFEYQLKYWTKSENECTTVTYYSLYKDGKVKFGKDGTCSKDGIESLKDILFNNE